MEGQPARLVQRLRDQYCELVITSSIQPMGPRLFKQPNDETIKSTIL